MLFKTYIALASAGDPTAVATVTDRLRPRLTKMAAFYARSLREETDDLLQEAYIGLLDALARVDLSIGDPEQFLLKHARWRMLDAAKRWTRRRCEALDDDRVDLHPTTDWDSEISEMWVQDFAEQLKPTQRAILCYLLVGMTWREAGDGLGCSSANIAYHVRQMQQIYLKWSDQLALGRDAAVHLPDDNRARGGDGNFDDVRTVEPIRPMSQPARVRRERITRVAV